MGKQHYACTPWGMPTYNIFGWQKPCYLLQDGYAQTFKELMETTEWERYGTESGNPKCANCMVHSGYEASAVNDTFGSVKGFFRTVRATLFNKYTNKAAPAAIGVAAPHPRTAPSSNSTSAAKATHARSREGLTRMSQNQPTAP